MLEMPAGGPPLVPVITTAEPYAKNGITTEDAARFMQEDVDQVEEDHNEIRL